MCIENLFYNDDDIRNDNNKKSELSYDGLIFLLTKIL